MDYLSSRKTGLQKPWTKECIYATVGNVALAGASIALFSTYPPNAGPAVSYAVTFACVVCLWTYCIALDPASPVSGFSCCTCPSQPVIETGLASGRMRVLCRVASRARGSRQRKNKSTTAATVAKLSLVSITIACGSTRASASVTIGPSSFWQRSGRRSTHWGLHSQCQQQSCYVLRVAMPLVQQSSAQ
jgi:hypothetical protein